MDWEVFPGCLKCGKVRFRGRKEYGMGYMGGSFGVVVVIFKSVWKKTTL